MMRAVKFLSKLAQSCYDFLDVGKSPRPADCIFALAETEEVKAHAVRMWKFGYAPRLILCQAERAPGRKKALSLTEMNHEGTSSTRVGDTRSEARALARYLRERPVRSLLVVSPPVQLRRLAFQLGRAFRKQRDTQLTFVAAPEKAVFASPSVRAAIWSELRKYLIHRFLLFR